jgi:type VI secretion system protein VasG
MPAISREAIFSKLGDVALRTLQSAFEFATVRRDSRIEPVHWLTLMMRTEGSDLSLIIDKLELDRPQLETDLTRALESLRRGGSSRLDFSHDLELMIERGWISASLLFGSARIRTGHLLHGMLDQPELRRLLNDISPLFRSANPDALAERFQNLTAGSVEEATLAAEPSSAVAGQPPAPGGDSALARFTRNLTEAAGKGEIDPVLGRDSEIRELIDILMRRRQNNPIIVGEAGVGKTALVEGLALRLASGDVPPMLKDVQLLLLDLSAMQAGASVRGEFENRLKQVIEEVQRSPKPIVLFIDEAHTLIGAGGAAGTGDAANLLKPALARGTLRTIAATTWSDYKKHIERDPALTRRFQPVQVDEPEEEQAIRMLRGVAPVLERHHSVQLVDEAITSAVRLSRRYIQGRQLPDKAVSLLDTSCARVAVSQHGTPALIEDARRRIGDLEAELQTIEQERRIGIVDEKREAELTSALAAERESLARMESRFESERDLVGKILELSGKLRTGQDGASLGDLQRLQNELKSVQREQPLILPMVDGYAVGNIVESWTGIPVGRMMSDEIEAVLNLQDTLSSRVIGQDHALQAIAKRIHTARAGLDNPAKPKGVFLLVGPSGVGKTETAIALAEELFGGEDHVIAINMSEFQEAHTVSTLKGAPPGYVGYGEGGRLTEAVRRKPYSVVLLDEIEKAHPDVHELFFQVFDKGVMEDGEGRKIDFKNTLILLTSNVGSDLIMKLSADPDLLPTPDAMAQALREQLLKTFPAAFLGRLVVVPYYPLSDQVVGDIIRLQLGRIGRRISDTRGIPFSYDESVVELIRSRCVEQESGGRMIDAILTGTLLPQISQVMLQRMRTQSPISRVHVGAADREFTYAFD